MNNNFNRIEDEYLGRFTAYFLIALRNARVKYLTKKSKDRFVFSLDSLLEYTSEIDIPQLVTYDLFESIPLKETSFEDIVSDDLLLNAILQLKERERQILYLHVIQRKKFREIAEIMGVKKKTLEKCYERAIKKIRSNLEGTKHVKF